MISRISNHISIHGRFHATAKITEQMLFDFRYAGDGYQAVTCEIFWRMNFIENKNTSKPKYRGRIPKRWQAINKCGNQFNKYNWPYMKACDRKSLLGDRKYIPKNIKTTADPADCKHKQCQGRLKIAPKMTLTKHLQMGSLWNRAIPITRLDWSPGDQLDRRSFLISLRQPE